MLSYAFSVLLLASASSAHRGGRPEPQTGSTLPLVFHVDPAHPDLPAPEHYQIGQLDSPSFGAKCTFKDAYATCGDYFDLKQGVDHALFCSPRGICAGEGAACGASDACDMGKPFLLERRVKRSALIISSNAAKLEQRRIAAGKACPEESEACSAGRGGFQCVYTMSEVDQCGGCTGKGGKDCSAISFALSTSCRDGGCIVHSCTAGYQPDRRQKECIDNYTFN